MKRINILENSNANSSLITVPCEVGDLDKYSFHIWFSDPSLAGALQLQASNNKIDWVDIKGGLQSIEAGESHIWNVIAASYVWTRFKWTPTAGIGTMSSIFIAKEPMNRV